MLLNIAPSIIALLFCAAFFVFWCRAPHLDNERIRNLYWSVRSFISNNYLACIICLIVCCPLLLQIVYSLPLSVSAVGAGDVLQFWGMSLGVAGTAYTVVQRQDYEKAKRIDENNPIIDLKCLETDSEIELQIDNKRSVAYRVAKVCGVERSRAIGAGQSMAIRLAKSEIEKAQGGYEDGALFSHPGFPSFIEIELWDQFGIHWFLNYARNANDWYESSRFWVGSPRA